MVFVWRSRLAHDSLIHFFVIFCCTEHEVFSSRKKVDTYQVCRSGSHVPSKTSRHRPLTALKLGSEDSQSNGAQIGRISVSRAL